VVGALDAGVAVLGDVVTAVRAGVVEVGTWSSGAVCVPRMYGALANRWSRRFMISSLGDSGLPVFQAGHCDWQRPHSVQVAMSSMAVHLKSSTLATPKVSSSGSASSSSRTLPLLIIGSSPPSAVPSGLRLVSTLIGAVKMCRCLE
jgi:hypothetical protein